MNGQRWRLRHKWLDVYSPGSSQSLDTRMKALSLGYTEMRFLWSTLDLHRCNVTRSNPSTKWTSLKFIKAKVLRRGREVGRTLRRRLREHNLLMRTTLCTLQVSSKPLHCALSDASWGMHRILHTFRVTHDSSPFPRPINLLRFVEFRKLLFLLPL